MNFKNYDLYDADNPVPGSAADVAKRKREYENSIKKQVDAIEIQKASENFPAFGRLVNLLKKES